MVRENSGIYDESKKKLSESQEKQKILEERTEIFIETKEKLTKKKKLDIMSLRHKLETTRSLTGLRDEVRDALREGQISRETYDEAMQSIEDFERVPTGKIEPLLTNSEDIPLSGIPLTQFFEKQKLGDNPLIDVMGFVYGFVVQGSAIMVIIAWKILTDLLLLPVDTWNHFTQKKL